MANLVLLHLQGKLGSENGNKKENQQSNLVIIHRYFVFFLKTELRVKQNQGLGKQKHSVSSTDSNSPARMEGIE